MTGGIIMAGHSQFKNIMHRKGAQDAKRSKIFNKLAREITVAAKSGLPDPAANPRLRAAITAARAQNMPRDRIDRAIKSGTPGGDDGTIYEAVRYEGYGPGGVALIVEALTENRNRTASEVRSAFTKHGGSLGEPGSVAYLFDKKGVVVVDGERYSEDDLMVAIDAGAEDVSEDGDLLKVVSAAGDLTDVRDALEGAGVAIESSELTMEPKNVVEVGEDSAGTLMRLMEALDDHDDVDSVNANFDIPESVLDTVGA